MPELVPAPGLVAQLRGELMAHLPFSRMDEAAVDAFVQAAQLRYHPPGEIVAEPAQGPASELLCIRRGAVLRDPGDAEAPVPLRLEAGDLFPIGALLAGRPVRGRYRSDGDTFVLALPAEAVHALARRCGPFADFLQGRVAQWLEESTRRLRDSHAGEVLARQAWARPLAELCRGAPVRCEPQAPLRDALAAMQERGVGSVVVTDREDRALGILTRHDLPRLLLDGATLDTPVEAAMNRPVRTLEADRPAEDAAQVMAQHGIRHVPVTRAGRVVGVVSERDLFALQRVSLGQIGAALAAAADLPALQQVAADIRAFTRALVAQGVHARQLTALVSGLNDRLSCRVIALEARRHGIDLEQVCWLALGSEGRNEQTAVTDQDNALVLADGADAPPVEAARAFGRAVNLALDACGFPLCRGGIMAGEPDGCAPLAAWQERFAAWVAQGTPEQLLRAAIYFDLRPIAGNPALAHSLQRLALRAAEGTPRFLKLLAQQALAHEPPLGWLGGLDTGADGSIDLKLQGTALIVEAARVYALAHGVAETSTRERLAGFGRAAGLAPAEYEGWIAALEFLQMLRLRVQLDARGGGNRVALATLNDIDRRILRESLRSARSLQQRLRLDYER
jgi:CBS domain-containing protein